MQHCSNEKHRKAQQTPLPSQMTTNYMPAQQTFFAPTGETIACCYGATMLDSRACMDSPLGALGDLGQGVSWTSNA